MGEMAGWAHHRSIEESRRILELFIREKKTFAMELRESGTVIGSVGVETYDERVLNEPDLGGREIGYAMGIEHWGKGLMTEAVRAVIECCFQRLDCDFLVCGHFAANNRSRRVIEKCGFCFVKENTYTTQIGAAERELLYIQYRPNLQK